MSQVPVSLSTRYAMNPWRIAFIALAILVALYFWPRETVIQGETMGTSYTIKYWSRRPYIKGGLDRDAAAELDRLTRIFSTYHANTEIQQLNQGGGTYTLSPDMTTVLATALAIAKKPKARMTLPWSRCMPYGGLKITRFKFPIPLPLSGLRRVWGISACNWLGIN